MPIHPDPAKIIVPRRHGEILIEPPLVTQASSLQSNVTQASSLQIGRSRSPSEETPPAFVQPLAHLQSAGRRHLLAAATAWARTIHADPPAPDAPNRPIILTGHQLEFYHPGVWAKVIVADELAKRCNATAFDLLVDHDTVDHRGFDVPFQSSDGDWSRQQLDFAPPSPLPADSLPAPTQEQFETWDAALAEYPQTHTDTMAFWLTALRPRTQDSELRTQDYAPWLSRARRRFETSLNIHVHHVPTSLLCTGPLWQVFVQAWIQNAPAWTAAYNRHLADYRREHRLKNPNRPMPNLATARHGNTATHELPFWIYRPGTARQRLTIQLANTTAKILHDGAALDPDAVLNDAQFAIRPRALTLTMYARLFFADLFIHGIGGALYDQITDRLLAELFQTVPSYSCVSAAWLLPLGQMSDPEDLPALAHRRHHIQHNPQLALDPFTARQPAIAAALNQRHTLIEQIAASLATARRNPAEKSRRRTLFKQLHALNADLHAHAPNILRNLDHQLTTARHAAAQNAILQHREFFLALHTTPSLEKFIKLVRT